MLLTIMQKSSQLPAPPKNQRLCWVSALLKEWMVWWLSAEKEAQHCCHISVRSWPKRDWHYPLPILWSTNHIHISPTWAALTLYFTHSKWLNILVNLPITLVFIYLETVWLTSSCKNNTDSEPLYLAYQMMISYVIVSHISIAQHQNMAISMTH